MNTTPGIVLQLQQARALIRQLDKRTKEQAETIATQTEKLRSFRECIVHKDFQRPERIQLSVVLDRHDMRAMRDPDKYVEMTIDYIRNTLIQELRK